MYQSKMLTETIQQYGNPHLFITLTFDEFNFKLNNIINGTNYMNQ